MKLHASQWPYFLPYGKKQTNKKTAANGTHKLSHGHQEEKKKGLIRCKVLLMAVRDSSERLGSSNRL